MMETKHLQWEDLSILSFDESCSIVGGSNESWDYALAEYVGMGVGYSAKKLIKLLKLISANLYAMQSNPKLLYQ
jgi:hypothetical protein